jgi:hypothetical protein
MGSEKGGSSSSSGNSEEREVSSFAKGSGRGEMGSSAEGSEIVSVSVGMSSGSWSGNEGSEAPPPQRYFGQGGSFSRNGYRYCCACGVVFCLGDFLGQGFVALRGQESTPTAKSCDSEKTYQDKGHRFCPQVWVFLFVSCSWFDARSLAGAVPVS